MLASGVSFGGMVLDSPGLVENNICDGVRYDWGILLVCLPFGLGIIRRYQSLAYVVLCNCIVTSLR